MSVLPGTRPSDVEPITAARPSVGAHGAGGAVEPAGAARAVGSGSPSAPPNGG
ncbi:hypothetical protein [Streptomyces avermitilis]|uniref:hypothetical protein n=1 Tax=Streptomyces avermitilis TaxID=33903 RepID=UPI000311EE4B